MSLCSASRRLARTIVLGCAVAAMLATGDSPALGQTWQDSVDYTKLKARVGAATPTGAGGMVSMVEAAPGGQYFVDASQPEFLAPTDPFGSAVNFTDGSGGAASGTSSHATFTVAQNFVGNAFSLAPGANGVTVYDANSWLPNVLNYNSSAAPMAQPYRVQNHSWIANSIGSTAQDASILRRFDYTIETGDMIGVVGANNNNLNPSILKAHPNLLVPSYNAIVVGRSDGAHSRGVTNSVYGAGRYRPDIVLPSAVTSAATARVSSAAAMLYESAGTSDATRSEVMKSILMAGATKQEFATWVDPTTNAINPWEHTPTRPLDDVFGAGEMNVYNSYLIQRGGKQSANDAAPAGSAGSYGWDYQDRKADATVGDLFYNFTVPMGSTAKELSIMLAWNVKVADTDPSAFIFAPAESLQNLDLQFYDSSSGFLGDLLQVSASTVDNVEHIYATNLAPGTYTLKVSGAANWDYGLAWRMATQFDQASADFDGSGTVDGADFLTWQRNSGTLLGASHSQGDANGDGSVDADDYAYLYAAGIVGPPSVPASAGGGSVVGNAGGAVHGVPEPAAIISAATGALVLALGQIWRRRRLG